MEPMRKAMAVLAVVIVVSVILTSPIMAAGPTKGGTKVFGGNGNGVWYNDPIGGVTDDHWVNSNNPSVRKNWEDHVFVGPGQGGSHANGNSVVRYLPGETHIWPPNEFY
jgi:hypothetical protein